MYQKTESTWYPNYPFFNHKAPAELQKWLSDRNSLTQRLVAICPEEFNVRVFDEYWGKPDQSEIQALNTNPNGVCYIREVHLCCGDEPLVYAKTVIPSTTLRGELQKITNLGTQPLGAVLFANRHIQRGPIEITKISQYHDSYQAALCFSNFLDKNIWGRRSAFYLANKPLLVSEIFLPIIKKFSL